MSGMFTVGQLARAGGLSRSTLLYYDAIGLLRPSGRSRSNYRLYSEDDRQRLQQICTYREAGLELKQIAELLDAPPVRTIQILERRLLTLAAEINRHRDQQRVIVQMLQNRQAIVRTPVLDKRQWVALLRATGLDDEAMRRWHVEFERMAPEAHREFLVSLAMADDEIEAIRGWSREPDPG